MKWQKRSILKNSQDGPACTRQQLHILGFSENPKELNLEVPDFKFLIDNSRATSNHAYCVPKIEENDINQIQLIWALFPSAFFFHISALLNLFVPGEFGDEIRRNRAGIRKASFTIRLLALKTFLLS